MALKYILISVISRIEFRSSFHNLTPENWNGRVLFVVEKCLKNFPATLSELSIGGTFLEDKTCIRFSPVVKNFSVQLDYHLNLEYHVNKLKSSMFLKMRSIAQMKPFLNFAQMKMIMAAVILVTIDYCSTVAASIMDVRSQH